MWLGCTFLPSLVSKFKHAFQHSFLLSYSHTVITDWDFCYHDNKLWISRNPDGRMNEQMDVRKVPAPYHSYWNWKPLSCIQYLHTRIYFWCFCMGLYLSHIWTRWNFTGKLLNSNCSALIVVLSTCYSCTKILLVSFLLNNYVHGMCFTIFSVSHIKVWRFGVALVPFQLTTFSHPRRPYHCKMLQCC
jgi:hypothetical protein